MKQLFAVELIGLGERRRIDGAHAIAKLPRGRDGVRHSLARVILEPVVVLVNAEVGRRCRLPAVVIFEIFVRSGREYGVAGRRRRRTGLRLRSAACGRCDAERQHDKADASQAAPPPSAKRSRARFFFTIARRGAGRERLNQPMRGCRDVVDRPVERRFICARRVIAPAQLSNELQRRRADLVVSGRRRKISEGLDVSAHTSISLSLFYGIHVYSARATNVVPIEF